MQRAAPVRGPNVSRMPAYHGGSHHVASWNAVMHMGPTSARKTRLTRFSQDTSDISARPQRCRRSRLTTLRGSDVNAARILLQTLRGVWCARLATRRGTSVFDLPEYQPAWVMHGCATGTALKGESLVAHDGKRDDAAGSGRRISPISLQKHLKGTNYPASKDDLVQRARSNSAPDDVVEMIRHLPANQYDSPAEVMRAFGQTR